MKSADASALQDRLAIDLIRIGAVAFSPDKPFVWASGIESPVYCDNRLTMSHPDVRRLITDGFAGILESVECRPHVIVGTATAGIPHAAWLAERLDLPMAYVRSSQKAHGRENRIEGVIPVGATAVVVEDLVSTGGSSLDAVEAVREAGGSVDLVLAIFSYGLAEAARAFEAGAVRLEPLTTFSRLIKVAEANRLLESGVVRRLQAWHRELGHKMIEKATER